MTDQKTRSYVLVGHLPVPNIKITSSIHQDTNHELGKIVFELFDPFEEVLLPQKQNEQMRKIGLWNETCFEIFLMFENGHYVEGNFNLAFNWNVFYFKNYRESPLTEWSMIKENPIKDVLLSREKNILIAEFPAEIKHFFKNQKIKSFSLTAVIKTKDNLVHYMAIKHADEKPNFHHPESFISF